MRNLNFFQEVDAHRIAVAFAGQKHFHKIGDDAKLAQLARTIFHVRRQNFIRGVCGLACGDGIGLPHALGHAWEWKMIQAAAHVSAGIAILQAPRKNLIKSGAGNNAELAEARHCLREPPARYAHTHAALNDRRRLAH